jgi:hypothetical protein
MNRSIREYGTNLAEVMIVMPIPIEATARNGVTHLPPLWMAA